MEELDKSDNHVTTRVDPALKQTAVDFADRTERTKAWVFAKAIELGLPIVIEQYAPGRTPKKEAA